MIKFISNENTKTHRQEGEVTLLQLIEDLREMSESNIPLNTPVRILIDEKLAPILKLTAGHSETGEHTITLIPLSKEYLLNMLDTLKEAQNNV